MNFFDLNFKDQLLESGSDDDRVDESPGGEPLFGRHHMVLVLIDRLGVTQATTKIPTKEK
ncbi:MAG: hypothetical protein GF347_01615 [Candidatus Moranbacteria bacterium]|nr:hypothetical protein [Candidatus Moranbacteria bacterium]